MRRLNRFVEETQPWVLAKDEADPERLDEVLYNLAEGLRVTTLLLVPYLPETSERLLAALGEEGRELAELGSRGGGQKVERDPAALPEDRGSGPVIDSHTHLFLCERPEAEVVAAAREAGVGRMLNVGLGEDSNAVAIAGAERHEGVFATVGRHPTSATGFDDAAAAEIARLAAHEKVRAIGETGLDYYREPAPRRPAPRLRGADRDRPASRACRSSSTPATPTARRPRPTRSSRSSTRRPAGHPVILHCFLAPWRVDDAIERGWYCSFAGNVTYPKSDALREAAAKLPDELLLVETDAPYLAPQPVRGKPNEPAHVVETAEVVAEARGVSYEELERTVEANARALFGW